MIQRRLNSLRRILPDTSIGFSGVRRCIDANLLKLQPQCPTQEEIFQDFPPELGPLNLDGLLYVLGLQA